MTSAADTMAEMPKELSEIPAVFGSPRPERSDTRSPSRTRLVREIAKNLHLSGSMFLRADFTAPWALESPPPEALAATLQPGARRIVLFHVVIEGCFVVWLPRGQRVELGAGDVVIFPHAHQHVMSSPEPAEAKPIDEIFPPQPWPDGPLLQYGGGGAVTSIVCGYLYSDDMHINPVLATMPPMIPVRAGSGMFADWVLTNVRYALSHRAEQGEPLMQRLPEMLFMECLARYCDQVEDTERGWLAAVTDPIVGRALAALHGNPTHAWTLTELVQQCGASRSVLDERFHRFLGCAPMQYLTEWRLQAAARELRTTDRNIGVVAEAAGYDTASSFSRAFKRCVGVSPLAWRKGRQNAVVSSKTNGRPAP